MLSFDPGSVHCGVAIWVNRPDQITADYRWKCQDAWEAATPEEFIDSVKSQLEAKLIDRVAGEAFFLQKDKALAQTGSSFGTVEVIGVVRHLCRWNSVPFQLVRPLERDACFIKMQAVKYRFPKGSDHVKSAVCVGAMATGWRALNHFEGDGVG